MKSVTLGIPTYGGAHLVNSLLASIHKSISLVGYSDFDVFVVDDGSPPSESKRIKKVVKTWSQQIENLRLFRGRKNLGNVARDNTIVEKSEGGIIVLLDSDIVVPDRWFTSIVYFLTNNKCGVASYLSEKVTLEQTSGLLGKRTITAVGSGRVPERATELASYAYGFTRENYERARGFDENFKFFAGDSDFCCSLAKEGLMSYRLVYPMVYHLEHATYDMYSELKARETAVKDLAYFRKKWGATPKQTEERFLKEIAPQRIKWYANYSAHEEWDVPLEGTAFSKKRVSVMEYDKLQS